MVGLEGRIFGSYSLTKRIGQGGMAEVYHAYHRHLMGWEAAIKVLSPLLAQDSTYVRRFKREANSAAALKHQHILPLLDFGEQAGLLYLVMPLAAGGSLQAKLRERRVGLDELLGYLRPLGEALDYAHRNGVVHRDVKPANVLFGAEDARQDGPKDHLFLVDFGIVMILDSLETQLTRAGVAIGTPEYMAPEQADGMAVAKSDVYSLGVLAYEALTGRVPFRGPTPLATALQHRTEPLPPVRLANPLLPEGIEGVLARALAKNLDDRFPTVRAFVEALEGCIPTLAPVVAVSAGRDRPADPLAEDSGGVPADQASKDTIVMDNPLASATPGVALAVPADEPAPPEERTTIIGPRGARGPLPSGDHPHGYTDGARRALVLAQEERLRLNHHYLGPEHILLGLVCEGRGIASHVLRGLGVQLPPLRREVEAVVAEGATLTDRLGLLSPADRVLDLAGAEARRLNHQYLDTEHLLLGVILVDEETVARVLQRMGIDLAIVRTRLIAASSDEAATLPIEYPQATGPGDTSFATAITLVEPGPVADPRIGLILGGRYRLDHYLWHNSLMDYFAATDLATDAPVLAKIARPMLTTRPGFTSRFTTVGNQIQHLTHEHILPVEAFGRARERAIFYFAMPLVGVRTAADMLRDGGPLPVDYAVDLLAQAAAALDHAHERGFVHRTLSPLNFVVADRVSALFVAGLGEADLLSPLTNSGNGSTVGAPEYLAPEVLEGTGIGPAADIYALGCSLFELLAGSPPYIGDATEITLGHMNGPIPSLIERAGGQLPPAAQRVIEMALAGNPRERYATAGALVEDFRRAVRGG